MKELLKIDVSECGKFEGVNFEIDFEKIENVLTNYFDTIDTAKVARDYIEEKNLQKNRGNVAFALGKLIHVTSDGKDLGAYNFAHEDRTYGAICEAIDTYVDNKFVFTPIIINPFSKVRADDDEEGNYEELNRLINPEN